MSGRTRSDGQPVGRAAVDVFLQYLKAEGARLVFGVPGGLLHPFFEALEADADFELVVTRHEEGAAFMADGAVRVGGGLGVCAGTSGPGATNLLTGVSVAFADGVPLLVVTGQAARSTLGKGAAQETSREDIDIVSMFKPVTKYSTMVTSAESFPHHLRRALRLALSGRKAPVHLNVPVDIWSEPVDEHWFDPGSYRPRTTTFDRDCVQAAAVSLMSAQRPVLLVGAGVASAGAEEHVRMLAEMLPALVATSPRGKGLFPEDHPLSLGVLGTAGHQEATDIILEGDIDVLVTVGASLNETTTLNWDARLLPSSALIQIDIEADAVGRNYPVDVALVGDAQTILVEIIYTVHRLLRDKQPIHSSWPRPEPGDTRTPAYRSQDLRHSEQRPLTPQCWRRELDEVLPDDAIVFSDIGGHMLFNLHHLCIRQKQRFVINMGFGSMGHGTCAPIGAALSCPGRPVVAIIGDGCFAMNGMELLTAVEYSVPVIWLVETNNMHGITWHGSQLVAHGKPMDCVRFKHRLEVAHIARAMGVTTWAVDGPGELAPVFRQALQIAGPTVIEIRVDPLIPPPIGQRAQALAGFIER